MCANENFYSCRYLSFLWGKIENFHFNIDEKALKVVSSKKISFHVRWKLFRAY